MKRGEQLNLGKIKDFFQFIFEGRTTILTIFMILLSGVLLFRVFTLQIINGASYQQNYTLRLEKEVSIEGTRGNIYDRNGNLLAYNELSYSVTFEDDGTYSKNATKNAAIAEMVSMIEENGDSIDISFYLLLSDDGELSFSVDGSKLTRFLADIYGYSYVSDMEYDKKLGYNPAEATPEQVLAYFTDNYGIDTETYTLKQVYQIAMIRYALSQNSYQKYISTVVATNVSEETMAKIMENKDRISGMDIETDTVRVYNSSKYFAQLLGYTGKISTEEYEEYSQIDDSYTTTDVVGKSGIEKAMESELRGESGYESFYVDSVGNILEVTEYDEASAGNDVYLTIDMDLQIAIYNLLEKELSGILYNKIFNIIYEETETNQYTRVGDVYFALLNNNVISIDHFANAEASTTEKEIYSAFVSRKNEVFSYLNSLLTSDTAPTINNCNAQYREYLIYIMEEIYDDYGIVDRNSVDANSTEYNLWKSGDLSLRDYLLYCISCNNIQTEDLNLTNKYADSTEIYTALYTYVLDQLSTDEQFEKLIYKWLIYEEVITGQQICLALFDQDCIEDAGEEYEGLQAGSLSAYDFIRTVIKDQRITPAQLALDPCNASCVITDPNSGQVLALVTYPGYDNNKLANEVDAEYYASLTGDLSGPLLNYATQQKTACGSTFKMITATAALMEGFVSSDELVVTEGTFTKITPSANCWIYPDSHGAINVMTAIRVSCNYFFFEMGYRMSTKNNLAEYDDEAGLAYLEKYASMYGLDTTSGIEIAESEPSISDEDAVRSSIGQGTHNYTTTQLARYVSTIANRGTVYDLSLVNKITDSNGTTLSTFTPTVHSTADEITDDVWDILTEGMELMVQDNNYFSAFTDITVAGKTGTAQESKTRPNHCLFLGFAPSDDPEISIAVRIPYGYGGNAAEAAATILKYYFNLEDYETLSSAEVGNASVITAED